MDAEADKDALSIQLNGEELQRYLKLRPKIIKSRLKSQFGFTETDEVNRNHVAESMREFDRDIRLVEEIHNQ